MQPIRRNDKRIWPRILYFINDKYNSLFIFLCGRLKNNHVIPQYSSSISQESLKSAMPTQTTWLLNIDRSINATKKLTGLSSKDISLIQLKNKNFTIFFNSL